MPLNYSGMFHAANVHKLLSVIISIIAAINKHSLTYLFIFDITKYSLLFYCENLKD